MIEFTKNGGPWCQVTSRRKPGACYCGSNRREGVIRKLLAKLEAEGETDWRDAVRTNQDEYHGRRTQRRGVAPAVHCGRNPGPDPGAASLSQVANSRRDDAAAPRPRGRCGEFQTASGAEIDRLKGQSSGRPSQAGTCICAFQ